MFYKYGTSNKRRRLRKPWWDNDLQELCHDLCGAETN
jgi:hypothetical protein